LLYNFADREIAINQYEGQENVNTNYNSEDVRILNQVKNMPRVVCVGDVDNDGELDWVYQDNRGNRYGAVMGFDNKNGVTSLTQNQEFFKRSFGYFLPSGGIMKVPENVLVIEN